MDTRTKRFAGAICLSLLLPGISWSAPEVIQEIYHDTSPPLSSIPTYSSSMHPAIRYTGRLVTDTVGTLQSENTVITGGGSQNGGLTRWGDYSAITIDPVDDCTFWYVDQYLKTTGSFNWSTRIASFKFPTCQ